MSYNWTSQNRAHKVLHNINFENAVLTGGVFNGLIFQNCKFDQTFMGSMLIDHCRFERCSGQPRHIESSRIFACNLESLETNLKQCALISQQKAVTSKTTTARQYSAGSITSLAYSPEGTHIISGLSLIHI